VLVQSDPSLHCPNAARATIRLIAISDRSAASSEATLARFEELGFSAKPRTVAFQLRDLTLPVRERLAFGAEMQRVARTTNQLFIVNDRLDFARLLGADGIHLGEAGVETADARRVLGERCLVSRALHVPERAAELDADVLLLSPILEPRKGSPALGIRALELSRERLAGLGRATRLMALGGVSADNTAACLAAGADGVALIGAIVRGEGPAVVSALGISR
jgi:thiamine-phosphate pyrophosphorylase